MKLEKPVFTFLAERLVNFVEKIHLLEVRRIWQLVENRYEFKPNLFSL